MSYIKNDVLYVTEAVDVGGFYGKNGFTSVNIAPVVTEIADKAFAHCSALKEVTIPATVQSIGSMAFYDCNKIASITLCEGLRFIGESAFACNVVRELTIPDSVTDLDLGVFCACIALKKVTIGKGLTSIPPVTFGNCGKLSSVTIPENVKRIEDRAFENCFSLEKIDLPTALTYLGAAFRNCELLKTISFAGTKEEWKKLKKKEEWDKDLPVHHIVQCADGIIEG